ncbi:MAG: HPr(Ser) kinase/phosphatase [Firmicutes bacterium]|nr:HPr(Ser) kinase/phosphatase [Bacillota bacterium]
MTKQKVRMLVNNFSWEQLTGDAKALDRYVQIADINRPGLELTGYYASSLLTRLVVLGAKEIRYINSEMDQISQRKAFEFLTSDETPGILICRGLDCPEILEEIANRKNFPVFRTDGATTVAIVNITNYLDDVLADSIMIHGELMRIYGVGVLITGHSGVGKSEIALELMKRGHQLISDDRVDIYRIHNSLVGKTASMIEGFMELRGVGIINVARIFGVDAYAKEARVRLHIDLDEFDDNVAYDRVGIEDRETTDILGIEIMKMSIPVGVGRPIATIIETAVSNFLLLERGIDSAKEFEERTLVQIEHNKEED